MTKNANNDESPKEMELNKFQQAHKDGELNVYKSIEAYAEKWEHVVDKDGNFVRAFPVKGTRRRSDLPSLSEQWRDDIKKRKTNE